MSSTMRAVYGSSSETHAPDLPYCANLKIEGAIGKRLCPLVMVVSRWPCRMDSGRSFRTSPSSSACSRRSPSAAARPPDADRCSAWPSARNAAGRAAAAPLRPRSRSSEARASAPMPCAPRAKKRRRVSSAAIARAMASSGCRARRDAPMRCAVELMRRRGSNGLRRPASEMDFICSVPRPDSSTGWSASSGRHTRRAPAPGRACARPRSGTSSPQPHAPRSSVRNRS